MHTFSAVLKTAGSQTLIAQDTASRIVGVESSIIVSPEAASSLAVAAFPSSTNSGAAHTFTVTAEDLYGNVTTSYSGTVHFTSSDPKATAGNGLPSDYTFTSGTGNDNGVHTFTATLTTVGSQSITATDTVNNTITGTQSRITVNPAAPSGLVLNGYPSLDNRRRGAELHRDDLRHERKRRQQLYRHDPLLEQRQQSDAWKWPARRLHLHDRSRRR